MRAWGARRWVSGRGGRETHPAHTPTPTSPSPLAQDYSATGGSQGKVTVRRFDAGSWGVVGAGGFSVGQARYVNLQLDSCSPTSALAFVAYQVGAGQGLELLL